MATWGKLEINVLEGYPNWDNLYYDYNTTSDSYHFIHTGKDDYTGLDFKSDDYFSNWVGTAMMEAFINHTMAMESLTTEQFVERYITNNRFTNTKSNKIND